MRSFDISIVRGIKLAGRSVGAFYYHMHRGRLRADGGPHARTIPSHEVKRLLLEEREKLTRKLADHERRWGEFQQLVAEASVSKGNAA
jgi:hypothetical protein